MRIGARKMRNENAPLAARGVDQKRQMRRVGFRATRDDSAKIVPLDESEQGPHCYLSPSWYDEQVTVPTWAYAAVHVRGRGRVMEDPSGMSGNQVLSRKLR